MERQELDARAEAWLAELPPFVQAVMVSGEDFLKGTGTPFDPATWTVGHSIKGWTVWQVTPTSIRFKRRNALIDARPLPY